MKYWEIIADNLSKRGWSWGYCAHLTREGAALHCLDATAKMGSVSREGG